MPTTNSQNSKCLRGVRRLFLFLVVFINNSNNNVKTIFGNLNRSSPLDCMPIQKSSAENGPSVSELKRISRKKREKKRQRSSSIQEQQARAHAKCSRWALAVLCMCACERQWATQILYMCVYVFERMCLLNFRSNAARAPQTKAKDRSWAAAAAAADQRRHQKLQIQAHAHMTAMGTTTTTTTK